MIKRFTLFVLLLSSVALVRTAHAATYYVDVNDPSCSDSGPGTQAKPFCSVSKAAAVTVTGDTVLIRPGIYRESLEETNPGVTWRGTGSTPDDVKIVTSESTRGNRLCPGGCIITKTPGRNHVYQFDVPEGTLAHSLFEFDRPTDLNRREPAEFSLGDRGSPENGVQGYYAWHLRTQAACADWDCPLSLSAALDRVDADEGTWIQDKSSWTSDTWTPKRTIYFHPRGNRNGAQLELEVGVRDPSRSVCTFLQDQTEVSMISCWSNFNGDDRKVSVGGGPAFALAGKNSFYHDIHAWNGRIQVYESLNPDLSNFKLARCFGSGGLGARSKAPTDEYPGIVIEDCEFIGGLTGINWEGPWGTVQSPLVFRRVILHDTQTRRTRRPFDYEWETNSFKWGARDNDAEGRYFNTHGWEFGGIGSEITKNVVVENSFVYETSDGHRPFQPQGNVIYRNNVLLGTFRTGDVGHTAQPNSVTLANNVITKKLICTIVGCGEFKEVKNNLFFTETGDPNDKEFAEDVYKNRYSFNDLFRDTTNILARKAEMPLYFQDPRAVYVGRGGDDYRLKGGSLAIDAGDNSNCAHRIIGSACDIGMYEYGASPPTGPDPIHAEYAFFEETPDNDCSDGFCRITCDEASLERAITQCHTRGGNCMISFGCRDRTINLSLNNANHGLVLNAPSIRIDGENRNIVLNYTGDDDPRICTDQSTAPEPTDVLLRFRASGSSLRNVTVHGFPDGIRIEGGARDSSVVNVRFTKICDGAVGVVEAGLSGILIDSNTFIDAQDKAVLWAGGEGTVRNNVFVNTATALRGLTGDGGTLTVEANIIKDDAAFNGGRCSTGIGFGGRYHLVIKGNDISCERAVRIGGTVEAELQGNTIHDFTDQGVSVYASARASLWGNTITNGTDSGGLPSGGFVLQDQAQADLGGGSLEIKGKTLSSPGGNTLRNNQPKDVRNLRGSYVLKAENNHWDNTTIAGVEANDIEGNVDVDPLASGVPNPTPTPPPTPTGLRRADVKK